MSKPESNNESNESFYEGTGMLSALPEELKTRLTIATFDREMGAELPAEQLPEPEQHHAHRKLVLVGGIAAAGAGLVALGVYEGYRHSSAA